MQAPNSCTAAVFNEKECGNAELKESGRHWRTDEYFMYRLLVQTAWKNENDYRSDVNLGGAIL